MFSFFMFIILLFLGILILPGLLFTSSLRKDLRRLTAQVDWLVEQARKKGAKIPKEWEEEAPSEVKSSFRAEDYLEESPPKKEALEVFTAPKKTSAKKPKRAKEAPRPQMSLEKLAANLPVWIGGIALALAGLFMVKYSIETGLLSPTIRLLLGGIFGIILLLVGHWIFNHPKVANSKPISQSLSGAGIAVLYVCLYAGTSFYSLLPPLMGFIGMAVVTAIAVVLSLRLGPPIAILGLLGGFVTPGLIESKEPNAQFLFLYLYFVAAGLLTVIRQKGWWILALPVVGGAFLWVLIWLLSSFTQPDGLWLGLFLLAISATVVFHTTEATKDGTFITQHSLPLSYLTLGGALLFMALIAAKAQYGGTEWVLFGLLSAGGIALSYFNKKLYGFVPWAAVLLNIVLLWAWKTTDPAALTTTLFCYALLFIGSSYWLLWKSTNKLSWGILSCVSSLLYYCTAYLKFHNWTSGTYFSPEIGYGNPELWSAIAIFAFLLALAALLHVYNEFQGKEEEKQKLLSAFILTATAFLSIGLIIELNQDWFRLTLVLEILVLSWLSGHVNIKMLRPLAGFLALAFGVLILPDLFFELTLFQSGIKSLTSTFLFFLSMFFPAFPSQAPLSETYTVGWNLVQIGLPAVLFAGSSLLFRKQKDDGLVKSLEVGAIVLISLLTYILLNKTFSLPEYAYLPTLTTNSTITNFFFFYGLLCLWGGAFYKRGAVFTSGIVLFGFALARLFIYNALLLNPVWTHETVGALPLFNLLFPIYALPILWLYYADKVMIQEKQEIYLPITRTLEFILAFLFVTLNIRQLFQGAYLDGFDASNMEIYSYSIAWLLMGLAFLFYGTLKESKTLRIASFAFIALSVGKVFLYDASELSGLLRVLSFFGLGISLLGLSWFYTRFVFKPVKKAQKKK